MDEEAQTDAYNAQQIREEIEQHLDDTLHSIQVMQGLLDDLGIYMPKQDPA